MLKFLALVGVLILIALVGAAVWVRNLSVPAERYHARFDVPASDERMEGGFIAVRAADQAGFERLLSVIEATDRTARLSGSAAEGHVSYVTRSAVFGFPDVTNVLRTEGGIAIRGHLIVGKGDMGVNRKRIEGWLAEAGLT